jgi:hypothetical protein
VHYVVLTAEAAMVLASPTSDELVGGGIAAAHWAAHGSLQCALHQPPPSNHHRTSLFPPCPQISLLSLPSLRRTRRAGSSEGRACSVAS